MPNVGRIKSFQVARVLMCAFVVSSFSVLASGALAQIKPDRIVEEDFVPSIWVDPDGCEHWVLDGGNEGYMSPHVRRDGTPVCRRGNTCSVMYTDSYFESGSAHLGAAGRQDLINFFNQSTAVSYVIIGHTDSRGADDYNLGLSQRRANSVARVAKSRGALISDVRGYGERMPAVSNATAEGMARNRRVEIICIQ